MSKNIDALIEKADALLAREQPPFCVRLPELWRDEKRVVRQAAIRFSSADILLVSYQERSGDVSARFKPVQSHVADNFFDALEWAEQCGQ